MPTIKSFIMKYPVLTYFILTFVISWGGVYILGAPYGMPTTREQFQKLWPIVFLPYFLGPSLTSILLAGFIYGKAGLRHLFSRFLKWRTDAYWYVVALLTAPLLVTLILFILSLISPEFLPGIITSSNRVTLIVTGIVVGLFFGGFLEELGWTGFAIPGLRRHYGIFTTGLIVGFLWGAWHLLPTYWGSGNSTGVLSLSLLLPPCLFYAGVLPAYRILMVWVYDRTGSLLVIMLMHMSLTANTLFILAPSAKELALMMYYFILTALLWIAVAVVAKTDRNFFKKEA